MVRADLEEFGAWLVKRTWNSNYRFFTCIYNEWCQEVRIVLNDSKYNSTMTIAYYNYDEQILIMFSVPQKKVLQMAAVVWES